MDTHFNFIAIYYVHRCTDIDGLIEWTRVGGQLYLIGFESEKDVPAWLHSKFDKIELLPNHEEHTTSTLVNDSNTGTHVLPWLNFAFLACVAVTGLVLWVRKRR